MFILTKIIWGIGIIGILGALVWFFYPQVLPIVFQMTDTTASPGFSLPLAELREAVTQPNKPTGSVEVVAENLEIPWGIAFLPNGDLLVTERPGRVVRIGQDKTVIPVQGVSHIGEGGLLGIAVHPDFKTNKWVYIYLTTRQGEEIINRVERYVLEGNQLLDRQIIANTIQGAQFHDGGYIKFGPDRMLYVTTGDAGEELLAQNLSISNGKILRIRDDGSIPEDNPFGTAVYSYGHRNVQGLAWDSSGALWATEHGPSGSQSGFDEINLIEKGKNYGWPTIKGTQSQSGMVTPIQQSGASDTWAPGGIAIIKDRLFFGGLRGQSLFEFKKKGTSLSQFTAHLRGQFGRIRAVEVGPSGDLYISTSNRDGRGTVKTGDDKIIRIPINQL